MRTYLPLSADALAKLRYSKQEIFADMPGSYDFALPQGWLDDFAAWCKIRRPHVTYGLIRSTTVWAYPESEPVTCCQEVADAFAVSYPVPASWGQS